MSTLMDLQRANLEKMAAREAAEKAPPEDADNTTILQSDKPTDTQTNGPTDQPTDKPTDNLTDRPTNRPAAKPTVRPAKRQAAQQPVKAEPEPQASPRRADGRTMRVRQNTADRTMVTSLRLAVETVEALDDFCWKNRQRKQDVVQAALDVYFAAQEGEG